MEFYLIVWIYTVYGWLIVWFVLKVLYSEEQRDCLPVLGEKLCSLQRSCFRLSINLLFSKPPAATWQDLYVYELTVIISSKWLRTNGDTWHADQLSIISHQWPSSLFRLDSQSHLLRENSWITQTCQHIPHWTIDRKEPCRSVINNATVHFTCESHLTYPGFCPRRMLMHVQPVWRRRRQRERNVVLRRLIVCSLSAFYVTTTQGFPPHMGEGQECVSSACSWWHGSPGQPSRSRARAPHGGGGRQSSNAGWRRGNSVFWPLQKESTKRSRHSEWIIEDVHK